MQENQEERILIERYLDGSLSGLELQQFMDRLESDDDFRRKVSFQNLLQEGILMADDERIKHALVSATGYKKSKVPFGLKLIATFFLVTLLGIIIWDYVGTNSNHSQRSYFSFSFFKKKETAPDEIKLDKQSNRKKEEKQALREPTGSVEESSTKPDLENPEKVAEQTLQPDTDSTYLVSKDQPEFVIKKDQLLISYQIAAIEKGSNSDKPETHTEAGSSLSQSAVEKLNPAAGLVEKETPTANYEVEFWISPINYRGYKLINNKLILFGIEEPDAVKLFRIDGDLFMRYGNDYYRLWPGTEFMAYKRVRDMDLPLTIKQ